MDTKARMQTFQPAQPQNDSEHQGLNRQRWIRGWFYRSLQRFVYRTIGTQPPTVDVMMDAPMMDAPWLDIQPSRTKKKPPPPLAQAC